MFQQSQPRFRHEVEWYSYFYVASRGKVAVCTENLQPCKIFFYTRREVEILIVQNKWNTFSLPIYEEALKHFPEETNNGNP